MKNCLLEETIDDTQTDSNCLNKEVSTSTEFSSSHVGSLSEKQFLLVPQLESAVYDSVLTGCERDEWCKDSAHYQSMSFESSQEQTSLCHSDCCKQSVSEDMECIVHHRKSSSEPSAALNTCLDTQKPSCFASGKVLPTAGIVMAITHNPTLCKAKESTVAQYENQFHSVPVLKHTRAYSVPLEIVDEYVDEDVDEDILLQNAGILMTSNCVKPVFVTEDGKVVKEEEVCTGMYICICALGGMFCSEFSTALVMLVSVLKCTENHVVKTTRKPLIDILAEISYVTVPLELYM